MPLIVRSVLRLRGVLALALLAPLAPASLPATTAPSPRLAGTPFLRVWQAEDYAASPVNWDLASHPGGFVYVANNSGVLEFDGAHWRTLPMPHGGRANTVALDARGRVWAGGHEEIARFEPDARGLMRAVDLTRAIRPEDGPVGTIQQIVAAADGVYLRSPLRIFRLRETPSGWEARAWKTAERFTALFLLDGAAYAHTPEAMVRVTDDGLVPVTAPFAPVAPPLMPPVRPVLAARPAAGGGAMLLTTGGPMRWRGPGTDFVPLSAESKALFHDEGAQAAAFLPDGRLAFAMTRSGLVILSAEGRLEQRIDRAHGLPHNRFEALAVDATGGVWVALHYGLARLQIDAPFALHDAAQGVEGGSRRFARQWDRMFVTNGEGVSWRDAASGRFHPVEGLRIGGNRLLALGDRLLVSSGGLKEIGRDHRARSWWNGVLYAIVASRAQPGWLLGGSSTGLLLFAPAEAAGESGWRALGRVDRMRLDVENVHDTGDGFVWVSTQAGEVWRVDFRAGLAVDAPVERFGPERGVPAVRRSENVQLFALGGDFCVASSEWLLHFDPTTQRFVPETRLEGFGATRGAAVVQPGEDGAVWLWTQRGRAEVVRATPADGHWQMRRWPLGPLQHLVVNSLFEDAAARTLWIAGQGALVSLDLDWQPVQPPPPLRVRVRRVETAARETLFGRDAAAAAHARPATLDASQRALRVEFAASQHAGDFRGRLRTEYRTRLDGVDAAWTPWSQEAHRDFTGLPFRELTFQVEARDMHGRVSAIDSLAFAIAPPWWLTHWAFAGYAAGAALAVLAAVRRRTRALRRRAGELEALVAERTRELRASNAELARLHQLDLDEKAAARLAAERAQLEMLRYQLNPHFLYNALGSIRSLVHSRPAEADEMTLQLADFCRMTLTRTDATGTLADELKMIGAYLDMERTRWRDRLQTRIDAEPAALPLALPPFLLLPLVENAIKYGTRTSDEVVRVEITVRHAAGALVVEVANTGQWVEPRPPGTGDGRSTGIGRENLRQRLRRHFAGAHAFDTVATDGWVRVTLRLGVQESKTGNRESKI